jgi:hypothetical protein
MSIKGTWVLFASKFSVPPEVTQSTFSSGRKHAKVKKIIKHERKEWWQNVIHIQPQDIPIKPVCI